MTKDKDRSERKAQKAARVKRKLERRSKRDNPPAPVTQEDLKRLKERFR